MRARTPEDEAAASEALERLCADYWYPLYAYARRRGNGAEDAQDLTQSFLAQAVVRKLFASAAPEMGKMRTFLLTAFDRYMADERHRARSIKRGGTREFISFDSGEARYLDEPLDLQTPEKLYERAWAYTVLDVALRTLSAEEAAAGRAEANRLLQPFLSENGADYGAAAEKLGIGIDAARHAVQRLRLKFKEIVRRQIAETLNNPSKAEIDAELAALRAALTE